MDSDAPTPPKIFWKLPHYLGRAALFLAFVPLAMTILCFVTDNAFNSLIDLYYWFVTPFQVCKWSAFLSLILAFATSVSARLIYYSCKDSYWNEFLMATRISLRAAALVLLEITVYIYVITFQA